MEAHAQNCQIKSEQQQINISGVPVKFEGRRHRLNSLNSLNSLNQIYFKYLVSAIFFSRL